jgi:hypothetical protein
MPLNFRRYWREHDNHADTGKTRKQAQGQAQEGEGAMMLPRRLARTAEGELCEENDPHAAFLVGGLGAAIEDREAEKLGLAEYLKAHPNPPTPQPEGAVEAKEEGKEAYEDKAEEPRGRRR